MTVANLKLLLGSFFAEDFEAIDAAYFVAIALSTTYGEIFMQFADTRILASISEQLSGLSRYVTIINGVGLYDINKGAEGFFCQLLNMGCGLSLKNLNEIKPNYPAIDLGDTNSKVCVQVTSENTSTKLSDTLRKFEENGLGAFYDYLIFLVISDKPLPNIKSISGLKVEVWNVTTLVANMAVSANSSKLNRIDDFLRQNLKSSVQQAPSFLPSMIPVGTFSGNCWALASFLGYASESDAELFVADVRNLFSTLNSLTSEERGFIYLLLRFGADPARGSGYGGDQTFAPIATIESRVGGPKAAYNLYQSLQSFNLVGVENEYQPDQDGPYVPVYSARFGGGSDVNILTAIRGFCNGDDGLLRRIIAQVDFSPLC